MGNLFWNLIMPLLILVVLGITPFAIAGFKLSDRICAPCCCCCCCCTVSSTIGFFFFCSPAAHLCFRVLSHWLHYLLLGCPATTRRRHACVQHPWCACATARPPVCWRFIASKGGSEEARERERERESHQQRQQLRELSETTTSVLSFCAASPSALLLLLLLRARVRSLL